MADSKITALTAHTTLIDTDVLPVVDITAVETKKTTWANIKSVLKTYFDTLYAGVTAPTFGTSITGSYLTASEMLITNGSKNIVSAPVATYPSLTELAYVKGVTSAIQTQLGTKAPSTSPTFATSVTGSYLTASEMLITDGSKNVVSAPVATYPSLTELSYVKGVTSAIQTQIGALPTASSTTTFTNKRVTKRTGTTTSSATPTINTDNVDFYSLTAQAADITSFTTNLSGTPTEGQTLWIAITGTAARAITWGANFASSGTVTLPTTTVTTTRLDIGFVWNSVTSKWMCIAVA